MVISRGKSYPVRLRAKTYTDGKPGLQSWSRRGSEVLDGVGLGLVRIPVLGVHVGIFDLMSESQVLDGVRVGLLRILGGGVRIFAPTPKVQFSYVLPFYFSLLHK